MRPWVVGLVVVGLGCDGNRRKPGVGGLEVVASVDLQPLIGAGIGVIAVLMTTSTPAPTTTADPTADSAGNR